MTIAATSTAGAAPASFATDHARPATATINGAGSTFDQPLFSYWAGEYSNASLNYQGVGSGSGQSDLNSKLVDFGAFDVPMLKSDGFSNFSKITQFPITLGGVSLIYNLPDFNKHLRLTGKIVADIYLGKIKHWNDSRLVNLNPALKKLKGKSENTITPVYREDSSGTSYIFTDFLSKTSSKWKSEFGASKLPAWPAGVGGSHSTGVDSIVGSTQGAIGYVETSYALANNRTPAWVQNRAGNFLKATIIGVKDDAKQVSKITTTHFSIVYQPGDNSYPISGFSWAGVYRKGSQWTNGKDLCKTTMAFFKWSSRKGQNGVSASPLFYVPLPPAVSSYERSQISHVDCKK
jgi:phosphate transport system substrate-binding protein